MNRRRLLLSESGEQRRREMLVELKGDLVKLRQRRRRRRRILIATCVAIPFSIVATRIFWSRPIDNPVTYDRKSDVTVVQIEEPTAEPDYIVTTEAGIHRQFLLTNDDIRSPQIESVSDEELVALCREAGQDVYLVTVNGERVVIAKDML